MSSGWTARRVAAAGGQDGQVDATLWMPPNPTPHPTHACTASAPMLLTSQAVLASWLSQ